MPMSPGISKHGCGGEWGDAAETRATDVFTAKFFSRWEEVLWVRVKGGEGYD